MKTYNTMNVTSSPITILDKDLRDVVFEVPLYQREYSWELEQISDLFYDIQNSDPDEGHFLGSLLLYEVGAVRQIIDGQQRLTTVFLFLHSILKALNAIDDKSDMVKDGISTIQPIIYQKKKRVSDQSTSIEPRLTTGNRDKKLFKAILQGQELKGKKDGRRKSHKLLINAVEEFIDPKIKGILQSDGVTALSFFLDQITACQYIVMTAQKAEDQKLLFKTLNSRGAKLSESDLIKNEVCNSVTGNDKEKKIQEAVTLWDEMREILDKDNANVDLFLFHFINSLPNAQKIRHEIILKVSGKDVEQDRIIEKPNNYPPIPEKFVFAAYESILKGIGDPIIFLDELKFAASLYVIISNPTVNKFEKHDKSFIYLQGLKALNITKCYPLLLRGKQLLNQKNFEKLAKSIEALSLKHSLTKREPKDLEKFYFEQLNTLKSDEDIDDIIGSIKQNPTMKDEETFKKHFLDAAPKSNISKMIIQRIIKHHQEAVDFSQKNIWFEHIMPQTPDGKWNLLTEGGNRDKYEVYVHSLGNLTYLMDVKNMGASNRDFEDKQKLYYNSSLITITKELLKYTDWNFDTIEHRQIELYNLAKDIWTI